MLTITVQSFTYEGELPALNQILDAKRRVSRHSHWNRYNEWKKEETAKILHELQIQRIRAVERYPVRLSYVIYVPNRRKDPDNVAAGAMKFMQDALKLGSIIKNDGWAQLVGPDGTTGDAPILRVDPKRPRVVVLIEEMVDAGAS